ncbi:hypothetical protein [Algoriphagus lacus]|uniref:hypothetical protein n=1 Tax=Algoriphagus lacus TaxID=2056311 RepID=UPI000E6A054D|nr:hypothetical protein [Algoriphagus lacus]
MKSLLIIRISLLFLSTFLSSCGPVLYSTIGQNVPLFQEKGEFSGQAAYSVGFGAWDSDGIGLQGAYSVSDKVAVMSSFYSLKGDDPYADDEWEGSGSYFELGGGLFGGDAEKLFLYEAFAGIGTGSIQNKSRVNQGEYINVKFLKPFFQPSVAFSSRYFDIALTPRIAYLTYTQKDDFNFVQNGQQIDPGVYFDQNDNQILFEPGLMIRGGLPGVKLELQYNYSTLGEPIGDYTLVNDSFFSIGLRFLISNRTTPKQKL